jgi:flagella basal body P-ring formation protein FlgA
MRCCAEQRAGLVLALLVAGPTAAQQRTVMPVAALHPAADAATGNHAGTLPAAIASVIAERWGVDATLVRLQLTTGEWPDSAATFRLLGDGVDGNWVVATAAAGTDRKLLVRAGTMTAVQKAARDLERAISLTAADLFAASEVIWGPPRRNAPDVGPGWVTKRRVRTGETLRPPVVEAPRLVRAGDAVKVVFSRGAITIALAGRAAGSAALGERVAVRVQTGRRLQGIVEAPGVVRVGQGEQR